MKTFYEIDGRPATDCTGSAPWNAWTVAILMPADEICRVPWFRIIRQTTCHEAGKACYDDMVKSYGYGNVRFLYLDPEMATGPLGKYHKGS